MAIKYVRRAKLSDFIADQTVTVPDGGGSDTVTDIPVTPDDALELELDDGSVYVVLGYKRK